MVALNPDIWIRKGLIRQIIADIKPRINCFTKTNQIKSSPDLLSPRCLDGRSEPARPSMQSSGEAINSSKLRIRRTVGRTTRTAHSSRRRSRSSGGFPMDPLQDRETGSNLGTKTNIRTIFFSHIQTFQLYNRNVEVHLRISHSSIRKNSSFNKKNFISAVKNLNAFQLKKILVVLNSDIFSRVINSQTTAGK
jgi:hypothetical protein